MADLITTKNPCMDKLIMPTKPPIATMPNPTTPTTPPIDTTPPTAGTVIVNDVADAAKTSGLYNLNVLQVAFIPVKFPNENPAQAMIDDSFIETGGTLANMRARIDELVDDTIMALELGSEGHVTYRIQGRIEIQEKYPLTNGTQYKATGYNPPLVDYAATLKRIDIADWVGKGVNQVWVLGPQKDGQYKCWETLMSSQWGNISNSDGLTKLPTASKSYVQIFFNIDRGVADVLESYCHQIEQVLAHVDNLATPDLPIKDRLFWGKFCGVDKAFNLPVANNGVYRCGWSHCQPNSLAQYDWWLNSSHTVTSDIFDWKPDGSGATTQVSRETFNPTGLDDGGLGWKIAWLKAIPRANNGLTYQGKNLTNWWSFVGEFDAAMSAKRKLTE